MPGAGGMRVCVSTGAGCAAYLSQIPMKKLALNSLKAFTSSLFKGLNKNYLSTSIFLISNTNPLLLLFRGLDRIQSFPFFCDCCALDGITVGGKTLPDWLPNPLPTTKHWGFLFRTNYPEGEMLLAAHVCEREKAICDHQNEHE